MKIYTRTGDTGETGLLGGPRVRKDAARIEAYGSIDELNAVLGLARVEKLTSEMDEVLATLQHQLFDIGAELAAPEQSGRDEKRIGQQQIQWQETTIDGYQEQLQPLREFILPGGTRAAGLLHLARCVCRRAERRMVTLGQEEPLRAELLVYVNRLSDLLFVMARAANHAAGVEDVVWTKGG